MNATTISYILDGLAVKLREGLNDEVYGLQDSARRLRLLEPDQRDRETHEAVEAHVKEVADSLSAIVAELRTVYWNLEWYVKPKEPADAPSPAKEAADDIPF